MQDYKIKCMSKAQFDELIRFLEEQDEKCAVMVLIVEAETSTSIQLGFNYWAYAAAKDHIQTKMDDLQRKALEQTLGEVMVLSPLAKKPH